MRRGWLLAAIGALAGCSAIVNPDGTRLGGDEDAGIQLRFDAGPGSDAGPRDGGGTPDAGPRPDTGLPCVPGARCEGDVLVSCRGGIESREPCAAEDAYCDVDECRSWVCEPGSRECSGDGRGVVVCSARGDSETLMPCDLGCDPETNACVTVSPACMGLPRVSPGMPLRFDLCRETDDDTYTLDDGCGAEQRANLGDRTFVLTLEEETNVVINLRDADGSAAIDTVVYVRSVCDDADTQLACDDDIPCSASTVGGCTGAVEVRESRIATRLEAGTYYIVADGFAYSTESTRYGCGSVELAVITGG